jgi:hypothetical protein
MNRVRTGIRANVSTFLRTPLNVVLALLLPVVVIEGWGQAMAGLPTMPTVDAIPIDLGRLLGALSAVAIISGPFALALLISSWASYLPLAPIGYPPRTLLATRLAALGGVTVVVAAVNYGVLWLTISPEAPVLTLDSSYLPASSMRFLVHSLGRSFRDCSKARSSWCSWR